MKRQIVQLHQEDGVDVVPAVAGDAEDHSPLHDVKKSKTASASLTGITPVPSREDRFSFSTSTSTTTTTRIVEQVVAQLSDVLLVYGGDKAEMGTKPNALGRVTSVVPMQTRENCGATLVSVARSGAVGSATAAGTAFLPLLPSIRQLALDKLPAVVHAYTYGVSEQLALVADHTDLMTTRETGAVILVSSSAQGAYDLAVVAHAAALRLGRPVVHAIDGPLLPSTQARVQVLSPTDLARFVPQVELEAHRKGLKRNTSTTESPEAGVQQITSFLHALAPRYRPFEYTGSPQADLVVVALGSLASSLEQVVAAAASSPSSSIGSRVGVVRVRLLRPWSAQSLLAVLPTTVQRVIVFDQGTHKGPGPLFLDVLASLQTGQVHLKPSERIRPQVASQQLAPATALSQDLLHNILALSPSAALNAAAPSADRLEIVGWGAQQQQQLQQLAQLAATSTPKSVQVQLQTLTDASQYTGVVSASHLRIGQPAPGTQVFAPVPCTQANVIAVDAADLAVLSARFDLIVAAGQHTNGASLLIGSNAAAVQLPLALQASIRAHGVQVVALVGQQQQHNALAIAALILAAPVSNVARGLLDGVAAEHIAAVKGALQVVALAIDDDPMVTDAVRLPPLPTVSAVSTATAIGASAFKTPTVASLIKTNTVNPALPIVFPEAFGAQQALRPDVREKTFQVKVTVNRRLTPLSYERNVFHMEFDTAGTGLTYNIGEALGVHGHNDEEDVRSFLKEYQLDPEAIVSLPRDVKKPDALLQVRTLLQLFTQVLDIFGRPSRTFYKALMDKASDVGEKSKLEHLLSPAGQDEFKARVTETVTFADMLLEFPLTPLSLAEIVELVPPIKPRHYSIASSQRMHPTEVHLLVVAVDWIAPKSNKRRFGQCTRYLVGLKPNDVVTVSVKPSVMKLPPLDSSPVVMAGLGTGMAPFRAFIQERAVRKREGHAVGPMILYFGSRHRSEEYLYGEELEAYHQDGVLTHLRLAFSRDQTEKVYIQHHIAADGDHLWNFLETQPGGFYLCGPTWPCSDVREAIVNGFTRFGGLTTQDALDEIERLKAQERYVLEVY